VPGRPASNIFDTRGGNLHEHKEVEAEAAGFKGSVARSCLFSC
jgi:hypothetical protein